MLATPLSLLTVAVLDLKVHITRSEFSMRVVVRL